MTVGAVSIPPRTARLVPPASILVATDGSHIASDAVRVAAALGRADGARIEVLSVAPLSVYPARIGGVGGGVIPESVALYRAAVRVVEEAEALVTAAGASCTPRVERGVASSVIAGRTAAVGADLVVIGGAAHGPIRGLITGSVSQHVVSESPAPVLVVRGGLLWPPSVCRVGFDGSPDACRAASAAASVLIATGATIELVLAGDDADDLDLRFLRVASMRRHVERLAEMGVGSVEGVDSAEPPLAALTAGLDATSSLVAVGRRGRGRVAGMVLGSVSWDVVTHAPVSVLVVPPWCAVANDEPNAKWSPWKDRPIRSVLGWAGL